jgi:formate-dependent nitrite reductase membrane component NrfD
VRPPREERRMVELQTTWGWLVATYLFLGGLGAGCFCAAAVVSLVGGERFRATVRFGAWVSASAIALGTVVLLVDVGKPIRAIALFQSFVNMGSWMAIGAWLLFGAIVLNGLFALLWTERALALLGRVWKPLSEKRRLWRALLAGVGIPVNLGVAAYTGILLNVLPFRPFWHTWLLPVLFTVSALDTGIGVIAGHVTLRERGDGARRLRTVLEVCIIVLITVEARVLLEYVNRMMQSGPDALRSVQMITSGALVRPFWIVVVGMGLGIPLLVCASQLAGLLKKKAAIIVPVIGLVSCLIGGWTLRLVVLSAGLSATVSSPSLEQIQEGMRLFLR